MRKPHFVSLVLLLSLPVMARAAGPCSDPDTADTNLFAVKTWSALRTWFDAYAACDDGYLAEGVSDFVTTSLATDWKALPQLEREVGRRSGYRNFVLRHIDETADADHLKTIVANATEHCPTRSARLCEAIARAARAARAALTEAP